MSAVDTAWCPDCRTRQRVEEVSEEGHMERHGELAYAVTHLDCGHSLQGPSRVVAAAPGAPYAGAMAFPAATTKAADLEAARRREAAVTADPWLVQR